MKNFFLLFVTTVLLSSFTVYSQNTINTVKPPAHDTTQVSQTALHDTASAGKADTAKKPDSLLSKQQTVTDTNTRKKNAAKTIAPEDTETTIWTKPSFSIGMGWNLGTFPLYSAWQQALPDSTGKILSSNPDTLGFTVKEPVTTYNILLPLYFTYTPFIHRKHSLGFEGSLLYFSKSIAATLGSTDTSNHSQIAYTQSLTTYAITLGAVYRHKIDEQYFKVDKVDNTSFVVGVSVVPVIGIIRQAKTIASGGADPGWVDAAKIKLANLSATGMGAGWRIGISSQQTLSRTSGMAVSILYCGQYADYFRKSSGGFLENRDINSTQANPYDRVSYVLNTIEIKVDFCFNGKSGKKKEIAKQ